MYHCNNSVIKAMVCVCICRLGPFGACFQSGVYRLKDAVIYASRPGLRIWKANTDGTVLMTYMFKDLLNGNTPVIPLLPDTMTGGATTGKIEEKNFGCLSVFDEDKLVTWNGGVIFVVDPADGSFVGWQNDLGQIQGVAVSKDEIFVLRRSSSTRVIRISLKRDPLNEMGMFVLCFPCILYFKKCSTYYLFSSHVTIGSAVTI